ncbi:SOS response-associated peptidase [Salinicola acroporae]|uniref:Abasic site processing protein n=1 Tax=Salinicola acroporae TaxID=1541440 RepID=A0ABT6I4N1_9GAMM|nr:SOS response-associated peptidase [Salinicola acroporae]MDH4572481.1 SOS response-associated peptidase [Salinicola acroporae]
MCGRFAFHSLDLSTLAKAVHQHDLFVDAEPRYNVPPGTLISVARRVAAEAPVTIEQLWWGYQPYWADAKAPQPINAKAETIATSHYFAPAFKRHRCLIPVDGWYEWLNVDGRKQPHYLTRVDNQTLYLAGVWTERGDDKPPGVAIITEPARGTAREVHDRMPLALDDDSLEPWLDPHFTEREAIRGVIRHIGAELIQHWTVSTAVNRPGDNGGPALIDPL